MLREPFAADGDAVERQPCPPQERVERVKEALALAEIQAVLRQLTVAVESLQVELGELRLTSAEQLRKAYERYEAVQHLALQQVDMARQEARELKARLATVGLDAATREDAMRGRAQQLREENQRLLGRIEELSRLNNTK